MNKHIKCFHYKMKYKDIEWLFWKCLMMCINFNSNSSSELLAFCLVINRSCLILHLLSFNFVNVGIKLKSTKEECWFDFFFQIVDCKRKYFQSLKSLCRKKSFCSLKNQNIFVPETPTTLNITNTISHFCRKCDK